MRTKLRHIRSAGVVFLIMLVTLGCTDKGLPGSAVPDLAVGIEVRPATINASGGSLTVNYTLNNMTSNALYVEIGYRMPYLQLDGTTLSLRFLVEPDPFADYIFFEVPSLERIEAGSSIQRSVAVPIPPELSSHFDGTIGTQTVNAGELRIQVVVGYGLSDFPSSSSTTILREFMEWQRIAISPIRSVTIQ